MLRVPKPSDLASRAPEVRRVLALDLSTKTGWAFFETTSLSEEKPLQAFKLSSYGLIVLSKAILAFAGDYPTNVKRACREQVDKIIAKVIELQPTEIVIEDTVPGRQALSQRFLEWLHYSLLDAIEAEVEWNLVTLAMPRISYIKTGVWRQTVGLKQSKSDAKNNKIVNKTKDMPVELKKKMRKEFGVRGRITKKHQSVRMVNERWCLDFKVKDNDVADAILLGQAFLQGARVSDGT